MRLTPVFSRLLALPALVWLLLTPALAITGGKNSADSASLRGAVVQITGPAGLECSGTVISRRLVLTAAHCFLNGPGEYRIRALAPDRRFRFAVADVVAIHPEFRPGGLGGAEPINDIALLRARVEFPDWLNPVALSAGEANDGDYKQVLVSGFGIGADGERNTSGVLRHQFFSMLDEITPDTRQLYLIDRKSTGARLVHGVCRGDSGGPVFRMGPDGYLLTGVVSAVMPGKHRDCGAVTAVTPVSLYRKFITELANAANSSVTFK